MVLLVGMIIPPVALVAFVVVTEPVPAVESLAAVLARLPKPVRSLSSERRGAEVSWEGFRLPAGGESPTAVYASSLRRGGG